MSEQTAEAVAWGWAESIAGHLCNPADRDAAVRLITDALVRFERERITAHTAALIAGAGELGERLNAKVDSGRRTLGGGTVSATGRVNTWGGDPIMVFRNPDGPEAAATIAALRAELATARLEGVRLGIEAAATALEADARLCDCFARSEGECACGAWSGYKTVPMERAVDVVRALDPAAIARTTNEGEPQ